MQTIARRCFLRQVARFSCRTARSPLDVETRHPAIIAFLCNESLAGLLRCWVLPGHVPCRMRGGSNVAGWQRDVKSWQWRAACLRLPAECSKKVFAHAAGRLLKQRPRSCCFGPNALEPFAHPFRGVFCFIFNCENPLLPPAWLGRTHDAGSDAKTPFSRSLTPFASIALLPFERLRLLNRSYTIRAVCFFLPRCSSHVRADC